MGAFLLGATCFGLAVMVMRGGGSPGVDVAAMREQCRISVVFFAPTRLPNMINDASGGEGFSHVAIDACEVDDDGDHLLIDCQPGTGVHRRLESAYGDRKRVRAWLSAAEGAELRGCARAKLGQPFDIVGLVVPEGSESSGVICSGLVWSCLPLRLQKMVPVPDRRPVAPNDIARAFGITSPNDADVEVA